MLTQVVGYSLFEIKHFWWICHFTNKKWQTIPIFQLLQCEYLLLFFSFYIISTWISLGFGQHRQCEDVTLANGKFWWDILLPLLKRNNEHNHYYHHYYILQTNTDVLQQQGGCGSVNITSCVCLSGRVCFHTFWAVCRCPRRPLWICADEEWGVCHSVFLYILPLGAPKTLSNPSHNGLTVNKTIKSQTK